MSAQLFGDKLGNFQYDPAAKISTCAAASCQRGDLMQKAQREETGRVVGEDTVDLTEVHIRRALEPRLQGHGRVGLRRSRISGFTIVHRYTSEWNGREVEVPVAQLRRKGQKLQLFWRRANGRWVPYEGGEEAPFVGNLAACLKEIERDRWRCFWG
jgi:hypothetical protein